MAMMDSCWNLKRSIGGFEFIHIEAPFPSKFFVNRLTYLSSTPSGICSAFYDEFYPSCTKVQVLVWMQKPTLK
jgi:hypothetical protein